MWYAYIRVPIDRLSHVGRFANDSKQLAHIFLTLSLRCIEKKRKEWREKKKTSSMRRTHMHTIFNEMKKCVRNPNANFLFSVGALFVLADGMNIYVYRSVAFLMCCRSIILVFIDLTLLNYIHFYFSCFFFFFLQPVCNTDPEIETG